MARARWAIVVLAAILAGGLALAKTLADGPLYEARTEVFFNRIVIEASLTGTPNAVAHADAATTASVQAYLSRLPRVVESALRSTGRGSGRRAVQQFLSRSRVETPPAAPGILTYVVRDPSRARAAELANAWASEGTAYRQRLDTHAVREALADLQVRLRRLERSGNLGSELYRSLVDKEQQLRTVITLQSGNGAVVRRATDATPVGRSPARALVLGIAAGAILGLAIVFVWEVVSSPRARRPYLADVFERERSERARELVP